MARAQHGVVIIPLDDRGADIRGHSHPFSLLAEADLPADFPVPFPLIDTHVMTLNPGHVRGNHFHRVRREIILVTAGPCWSVHWDTGAGTSVQHGSFKGSSATVLLVPPKCSHAVRNDGDTPLHLIGLSDHAFRPEEPDVFKRVVIPDRH